MIKKALPEVALAGSWGDGCVLLHDNFSGGSVGYLHHVDACGGQSEGAGAVAGGFGDEPSTGVEDADAVAGAALDGDASINCADCHLRGFGCRNGVAVLFDVAEIVPAGVRVVGFTAVARDDKRELRIHHFESAGECLRRRGGMAAYFSDA